MSAPASRHLVLTLGRSGSNWLVSALNQHHEAVNYGEVLGEWTTMSKLKSRVRPNEPWGHFIDRLHTSHPMFLAGQATSAVSHLKKKRPIAWHRQSSVSQIGIKEFATNFERFDLMTYLEDRPHIKVVSLSRDNTLKRYVSVALLRKTQQVLAQDSSKAQRTGVHIDTKTLISELEVFEAERQLQQFLTSGANPTIEITYEDLFDPALQSETMNNVFDFLGLDPIELASGDSKLNASRLEDSVENYEQVRNRLLGTQFERYLGEQTGSSLDKAA